MSNVIDITERLKYRNHLEKEENKEQGEVCDFTEARQEILNRDRRNVKRTILTQFVGAFVVVPEQGLLKASLYDISDDGLSFDLELTEGGFNVGDEVAMRVYLNHSTYFPFTIHVKSSRIIEEENVIRHGVSFAVGTLNDVALHHFVKFIENVSASLKKDSGDVLVSNIS